MKLDTTNKKINIRAMHKLKRNVERSKLMFGGKLPTLDMVLDEMVMEEQEAAAAEGTEEGQDKGGVM